MEWILIIAVIGAIGFLIYVNRKDEKADDLPAPKPAPTPTPPVPPPQPNPVSKPETAAFVSIYEYSRAVAAKRCVCCDGENDWSAQVCCICGSRIKR